MQKINCAIYVRKSSEKGLEQEFNSLHNQEEACKNYILSQTFNGWKYYKTYEDGGISGGTMKRPALLEMLDDMKKGLVQVVVCYKVDRLSRSIIDFHNMMKEFEKYNCNFVSITQAFDTSTSMGKLTLNMLLSFAQFEREVTSERIRDKVAASKAKGIWTGGPPSLGYDVKDKKLVINSKESELVRLIFNEYLKLKSISTLREFLQVNGFKSKEWKTSKGKKRGGANFSSSILGRILRSKIYIGKIEDKKCKKCFEGLHKPIIDKKLFKEVQSLLDNNKNKDNESYSREGYLLSGKIYDQNGNQFKNQKSSKDSIKKYRYYKLNGNYLPAGDVEEITFQVIENLFNSHLADVLNKSMLLEFKSIDFSSLAQIEKNRLIKNMIDKIIYHDENLMYFVKIDDLSYLKAFCRNNFINTRNGENEDEQKIYSSEDGKHLIIEKEICFNNRPCSNKYVGKGKKIITVSENHNNLIKALSIGWRYGKMLMEGISVNDIRSREKIGARSVYRYLNLNCLSPNIVNDIMDSRIPQHVNLQTLFEIASKHAGFDEQEKAFYDL